MKIITYHYIQEYNKLLPNFNFLHIDDFRKQLDYFQKEYYFPTKIEFDNYMKNKIKLPSNSIILTFDDGLSCHYTYVFPELLKRNLWGIFFINSLPYINNKILNVHKIHLLVGSSINNNDILEKIYSLCKLNENSIFKKKNLYKNLKYENKERKIKRFLNIELEKEISNKIINKIFNYYFSEKYYNKQYYLLISQIQKMNKKGMLIGNHTVNHYYLSNLNKKDQEYEILNGYRFLERINIGTKLFAYPYGRKISFNNKTKDILKKLNTKYAFTTEKDNDNKKDLYEICRIDCNEFKYGQIYDYKNMK